MEVQKKSRSVEELVREFIGEVHNFFKVDIHNLWGNRLRVNVWTQEFGPERVVATNHIHSSYFMEHDDGVLRDKTIRK